MKKINKENTPIKEIKTRSLILKKKTKLLYKPIKIYNGKNYFTKFIDRSALYKSLGMYVTTKKLGRGIHDSERNRKRKNKKKGKKKN